jgi:hypothetical protein
MIAVPPAGSMDKSAITPAHNTGAWIPKTQKMKPPSTPCTAATMRLPLTIHKRT